MRLDVRGLHWTMNNNSGDCERGAGGGGGGGGDLIGLDLSTRQVVASVEIDEEHQRRLEERRKCSYLIDDLLKEDLSSNTSHTNGSTADQLRSGAGGCRWRNH